MFSMLIHQINAVPRSIVQGTLNLTDFVGQKLDQIADGLSGKNMDVTGTGSVDDPITQKHMAFMENARRTRPVNYTNLAKVCSDLMAIPDADARKKAIMEAFN